MWSTDLSWVGVADIPGYQVSFFVVVVVRVSCLRLRVRLLFRHVPGQPLI